MHERERYTLNWVIVVALLASATLNDWLWALRSKMLLPNNAKKEPWQGQLARVTCDPGIYCAELKHNLVLLCYTASYNSI